MSSLNQVNLIGRLGKDPEVRAFPDGGVVANVSIATTEKWKDKTTGERKEETTWHNLSFNGRLAEIVQQYVFKGDLIYVEGSLRNRKYIDKAGVEKYITDIRAGRMQMLSSPQQGEGGQQQAAPRQAAPQQRQAAPAPSRAAPARNAAPARAAGPAGGPSGFDDFDDIPFIDSSMFYDMTPSKIGRSQRVRKA